MKFNRIHAIAATVKDLKTYPPEPQKSNLELRLNELVDFPNLTCCLDASDAANLRFVLKYFNGKDVLITVSASTDLTRPFEIRFSGAEIPGSCTALIEDMLFNWLLS